MLDHFTLSVTDLPKAISFYTQALAPLGYGPVAEFPQFCGFGPKGKPMFWLKQAETPTQPLHIAFSAASRALVDAFYAAALKAGASDNGAPGVRADYHPSYYAAFVIDPMGHPIEAVCHAPVAVKAKKAAPAKKPTKKKR